MLRKYDQLLDRDIQLHVIGIGLKSMAWHCIKYNGVINNPRFVGSDLESCVFKSKLLIGMMDLKLKQDDFYDEYR